MKLKSFFLIIILVFLGCSIIPHEVVELSYHTGEDLVAINESYIKLIDAYFENLINQRLNYLDNDWYPRFLEIWITDGELVPIARGEKIWSDYDQSFINSNSGDNNLELLNSLNLWVNEAIIAYDEKRVELIQPLEIEKENLIRSINLAFMQTIRANSVITAHLNSLRKVSEVQDQLLESLNLKNLRNEINNKLIIVSEEAEKSLEKIKEIDTEQIKRN